MTTQNMNMRESKVTAAGVSGRCDTYYLPVEVTLRFFSGGKEHRTQTLRRGGNCERDAYVHPAGYGIPVEEIRVSRIEAVLAAAGSLTSGEKLIVDAIVDGRRERIGEFAKE